ncbi:MAG: MmgE/PrpD family protein, partial [Pseudomonadota bacterium]
EALGIAEYHGPRSPMMRCIDHPTMVKDGSGWGAMAGVSAAHLAAQGFTGAPATTLEGADVADIWADLGTRWYISEQYIKLYPVCRWAQPAVEAALAVMRTHEVSAGDVVGVEVETFHEASRLAAIPSTTEEAQYSLPFSVAAAILRGTIGADEVSANGYQDAAILALARTVRIAEREAFNTAFPARRFAVARLRLRDGAVLSSDVTEAQGDPEDALGDEVVLGKFERLASSVLGEAGAGAIRRAVEELDRIHDAGRLCTLMGALPRPEGTEPPTAGDLA